MSFNLEDEEDVKSYVENLGIEYRFGCFKEKKPESCHLLGDYFEGIKRDFEKAARIYGSNCDDSDHTRSCYKYAVYNYLGKGKARDYKNALTYFEKACSIGDRDACLQAGVMCVTDDLSKQVIPRDYVKGLKLLNQSCSKENASSCHVISGIYLTGIENGIQKDMTKAFEYASKGCDLDNIPSCANISLMYRRGEGVEQNLVKSEEYKKRTLNLQDEYKRRSQTVFQQGT